MFVYYWDNSAAKAGDIFNPQPFEAVVEQRVQDFLQNRVAVGGLVSISPMLIRIEVPGELSGAVLKDLALLGVTASRLFPGYDGVARAILERRLWSE
jgi:hypothetical protein